MTYCPPWYLHPMRVCEIDGVTLWSFVEHERCGPTREAVFPDGRVVTIPFTSREDFGEREFAQWLALGCPGRVERMELGIPVTRPLDTETLNEMTCRSNP